MYIVEKIKDRINEGFNNNSLKNIETVNSKLNHSPNTSNYKEGDAILFI